MFSSLALAGTLVQPPYWPSQVGSSPVVPDLPVTTLEESSDTAPSSLDSLAETIAARTGVLLPSCATPIDSDLQPDGGVNRAYLKQCGFTSEILMSAILLKWDNILYRAKIKEPQTEAKVKLKNDVVTHVKLYLKQVYQELIKVTCHLREQGQDLFREGKIDPEIEEILYYLYADMCYQELRHGQLGPDRLDAIEQDYSRYERSLSSLGRKALAQELAWVKDHPGQSVETQFPQSLLKQMPKTIYEKYNQDNHFMDVTRALCEFRGEEIVQILNRAYQHPEYQIRKLVEIDDVLGEAQSDFRRAIDELVKILLVKEGLAIEIATKVAAYRGGGYHPRQWTPPLPASFIRL